MFILLRIFIIAALTASTSALAKNKTVQIVTFEAPPHMDPKLPEQGAGVYALRQTFLKAGYDLKISFAPLKRAKVLALETHEISGYFPVSPYDLDKHFAPSNTIYVSPWVIAERKDHVITWKKPADLGKYVGSANLQYTQPTEIVKLVKEKKLNLETAPDDTVNIIKLANKRIDYIFIDATMFKFLTMTNPEIKPFADKLQINATPVELLDYTVGFKKNPSSQKIMDDFNKVATKELFTGFVMDYYKKYGGGMTP